LLYISQHEKKLGLFFTECHSNALIDDLSHFNGVDHRLRLNIDVHGTDTSTEILSVDFRPALYYLRTGLMISFIQFLFPNFSPLMTKRWHICRSKGDQKINGNTAEHLLKDYAALVKNQRLPYLVYLALSRENQSTVFA